MLQFSHYLAITFIIPKINMSFCIREICGLFLIWFKIMPIILQAEIRQTGFVPLAGMIDAFGNVSACKSSLIIDWVVLFLIDILLLKLSRLGLGLRTHSSIFFYWPVDLSQHRVYFKVYFFFL